ncbi:hypothetical protein KAJ38_02090 [Candidatus Pacearchaeota archaeon]|nr:hypothetical protein [Candidatus Pacearchaeota archaeon]
MEVADIVSIISDVFSREGNLIPILIFFTTIIVCYSVFIFYFYRYLAKKNLIDLNFEQYNQSSNPTLAKFFAVIFYILEYIIILPILTSFWFTTFAILILVLSEGIPAAGILLISAALVASVRITSYISENLSKDLAKMLPFTLLAIAITRPSFFTIGPLISRIQEIPLLFSNLLYYLLFIVTIELTMRTTEFFKDLFSHSEGAAEEEIEKTETEETKVDKE